MTTKPVLTKELEELLREVRERLLVSGIDGVPYLIGGALFVRVNRFWMNDVNFVKTKDKAEDCGRCNGITKVVEDDNV